MSFDIQRFFSEFPPWPNCVKRLRGCLNQGYCWHCRSFRNELVIDPLFDDNDDTEWVGICTRCVEGRLMVRGLYETMNICIVPNRYTEPTE